ncbi:MAG: ABC transporter ATP-binding protein [Pseudomonadota bacterium]
MRDVSQLFLSSDGNAVWALRDVSLTIAPGEFVCLIGPSGCGKTTLLHLIAGFLAPIRGEVLFRGQRVVAPGPERGVVFQDYALFAWMTARQNVEFGLKMRGLPRAARRAQALDALGAVQLSAAADRYPHELSGGMRQRVAVARALVNRPALLLMDEPFAAVDAMTRATLQSELLRLWQDAGFGVVFITHNIDEAVFLGQRIIVMGPQGSGIKRQADVGLPYPRHRDDGAFGTLYAELEQALQHDRSIA